MKAILLFCLSSLVLPQEMDSVQVDTIQQTETDFPEVNLQKDKAVKLQDGDELFFDFKDDIHSLQNQIDSLKRVIRVIERNKAIPTINEDLLKLIQIPELQHRIELTNGTVVVGEIIEENDQNVILQTSIGQLFIDKNKVVKIDEELPPVPKIELAGEPFVKVYPDREEITGVVKNTGKARADFVRIIANLWTPETELAYTDSAFVKGTIHQYATGIITDSAIEPGGTAQFTIVVQRKENGENVEYRTYDFHWTTVDN